MSDEQVAVTEKIGVSLPLGEYEGFIKVEFSHTRMSPSSSEKDLKATTKAVQAFNDQQLAKRYKQLRKVARGKK